MTKEELANALKEHVQKVYDDVNKYGIDAVCNSYTNALMGSKSNRCFIPHDNLEALLTLDGYFEIRIKEETDSDGKDTSDQNDMDC